MINFKFSPKIIFSILLETFRAIQVDLDKLGKIAANALIKTNNN